MEVLPGAFRATRRQFLRLAGAAGLGAVPGSRLGAAFAAASNPLIALDFAHAQSLLAVGIKDFGLAERWRYLRLVQEPRLPETVFDVGTLTEPNLELLADIKPRAILHSREWPTDTAQLQRIAPLREMSIYTGAPAPLGRARQALVRIAEIAGEERRASDYLAGFEERMQAFGARLRSLEGRRVMVLWAATPRDFWTLGRASLVHDVLDRVGLRNAITEPGDSWGWLPVTMHELVRLDDVIALHFGPIPNALDNNPFWQNLGLVRRRRLVALPSSWLFGGVPEAERIARLLTHALEGSDHLSVN